MVQNFGGESEFPTTIVVGNGVSWCTYYVVMDADEVAR